MSQLTIGQLNDPVPDFRDFVDSSAVVWVRARWDAEWELAPYLVAMSATEAALPGRSTAQFQFLYGVWARQDETAFGNVDPVDFQDYYVAIQVIPGQGDPYTVWCGILPAEEIRVAGTRMLGAPEEPVPAGEQMLTAHGFEYLLERRVLEGAILRNADASPYWIERRPTFNARGRYGQHPAGNRSQYGVRDYSIVSYAFGSDHDGGEPILWSLNNILEYLLYWSLPTRTGAEPEVWHVATDSALATYLSSVYPTVTQRGDNVLTMLMGLLQQRRGLACKFAWGDDANGLPHGDGVSIEISSLADEEVVLGNITFPANPNTEVIELDTGADVIDKEQAIVSYDTLRTYDEILVEGSRVRSCFTAACLPDFYEGDFLAQLEPAWSEASESAYANANDNKRRQDVLARVYRAFRLPADFDWQDELGRSLNPAFDNNAVIDLEITDTYWNHEVRLLPRLPIQDPSDTMESSKEPRYLAPFAVIERLDSDGINEDIFVLLHDPGEDENGERPASAAVHPEDREGLIRFSPHGKPPHMLARNHFMHADDEAGEMPYDYEHMLVTLCVETDVRPRVYVAMAAVSELHSRRLLITLPEVQVWVAAPTVVVGVKSSGQLDYREGDQVLRDDTDRLRQVAAVAKAWYGKQRATIKVTTKGLFDIHPIGTFLTSLITGKEYREVNTPVTSRSWDFISRTTTISTGYIEFEVRA